jgi:hypothetical protein
MFVILANLILKETVQVERIIGKCSYIFSYMYVGCSGNSHIRMRIAVGTFAYVREFQ